MKRRRWPLLLPPPATRLAFSSGRALCTFFLRSRRRGLPRGAGRGLSHSCGCTQVGGGGGSFPSLPFCLPRARPPSLIVTLPCCHSCEEMSLLPAAALPGKEPETGSDLRSLPPPPFCSHAEAQRLICLYLGPGISRLITATARGSSSGRAAMPAQPVVYGRKVRLVLWHVTAWESRERSYTQGGKRKFKNLKIKSPTGTFFACA